MLAGQKYKRLAPPRSSLERIVLKCFLACPCRILMVGNCSMGWNAGDFCHGKNVHDNDCVMDLRKEYEILLSHGLSKTFNLNDYPRFLHGSPARQISACLLRSLQGNQRSRELLCQQHRVFACSQRHLRVLGLLWEVYRYLSCADYLPTGNFARSS